jgi:signal transduction histidine kinase
VAFQDATSPDRDESHRTLNVLLVEDSDEDVWLLRRALRRDRVDTVNLVRVRRLDEARRKLGGGEIHGDGNGEVDVILLDLNLADSFGLETVRRTRALAHSLPIVVLTSVADSVLGLGAIHEGAQDYLIKGQVSGQLLDRALHYAIERHQHEQRGRLLLQEQTARAAAEETLHARDEFLSVAAHELYTPISAMQLSVESCIENLRRPEGPDQVALARKLEIVERQAKRLVRLVGSLLEVSRIHMSRLDLLFEQVDLGSVVAEVVAGFETELARTGSSVRLGGERSLPGRWDRSRIEQVVSNLLSNAIKYGAGRPIDVTVRGDPATAVLTVTDRGIGIPQEMQAHIFKRFERAAPSRQYGGLGLGLYVVNTIVRALGGSVRVASRPGAGSTFTVKLPREQPSTSDAARSSQEHRHGH